MATTITALTAYSPVIPTDTIPVVDITNSITKKSTVLDANYVFVFTTTGDVSTASTHTTLVNVTGCVFTYVSGAVYRIRVFGRLAPGVTTTGTKLCWNVSTAITDINSLFFNQLATTGTLSSGYSISDDAGEGVTTDVAVAAGTPFALHALFRPGANTGTCQLRMASEVDFISTIKGGTTMVVERIA